MRARVSLMAAALAVAMLSWAPLAGADDATAPALSADQKAAVEVIVKQYIVDHPEIVGEALMTLQNRQQQSQESAAAASIKAHHKDIFDDGQNTVVVNPGGDVTMVEFLDYNCTYCKAEAPHIADLVKRDPGVRLVIKEFPILGPGSVLAARWALAAREQGKYAAFHEALMSYKGQFTDQTLADLATKTGLNAGKLSQAANSAAITAAIKGTYDLADALGIGGTPAIIIGDTLIPGAAPLETLQQAIAEARKKKA